MATLNFVQVEALNQATGLGIIPDWQFYPQPPPIGTGKFEEVVIDLPGACPSYGISGAMGLGQDEENEHPQYWEPTATQMKWMAVGMTVLTLHSMLRIPLAVVTGVHGYKRNDESGTAALGWGALGFIFPFLTTGAALLQGYGKPKER